MSLFLFVKSDEPYNDYPPPQVVSDTDSNMVTVDGVEYTRLTDIVKMNRCRFLMSGGISQKQIRDCIKYRSEAIGWDNLTTEEQQICAAINIGTGAQILAAIPDFNTRLQNSYNYLLMVAPTPTGEAAIKSLWLQAIFYAATKHIEFAAFGDVAMPQMCFAYLNERVANRPSVIGTNYLQKYVDVRLQGVCKGDGLTGLYDFFTETVGSEYHNAGVISLFYDTPENPLAVSELQWLAGGFASGSAFAEYCTRYLDFGLL
jgi:hypothetical protein